MATTTWRQYPEVRPAAAACLDDQLKFLAEVSGDDVGRVRLDEVRQEPFGSTRDRRTHDLPSRAINPRDISCHDACSRASARRPVGVSR